LVASDEFILALPHFRREFARRRRCRRLGNFQPGHR